MSRSRPGHGQLGARDRVGRAQRPQPIRGDLAHDPDRESGAGERLPPDDRVRHAEGLADMAYLVLEQQPQRLHEGELQVLGQPADVVVALDVGRAGPAAGLHDVGIERPLDEEADRVALGVRRADHVPGRLLEDPDELAADRAPLVLGIRQPGERGRGTARARRRPRGTPRWP